MKQALINLLYSILLTPCAWGESPDTNVNFFERGIPLYYWDARTWNEFTNFGDNLSEKIAERIVGHRVTTTFNRSLFSVCEKRKLVALGSVLHMSDDGDVIWGTGVNGKHPDKNNPKVYRFTNLDVRAVRGPLTRQFLLDMGIDCPEVYGDPALLFPLLFPEFKKSDHPSREYIIIPHYFDEPNFLNDSHMVSVKEDWEEVVKKILDSRFVISSSLHGIIVAEAFGIPARYLRVSDYEPIVQYADYYYGTNRFHFQYAKSIDHALRLGGEPSPSCDLEKLLQAFPYECFPKAKK